MRITLRITSDGLVYQCDNEQPMTVYGSAANSGVQFDDEYHTQMRAFGTKSPYISSIRVVQDGIGGRDFSVPVGMEIVLDGTTVESGTAWQVVSFHWCSTLYQHKLYFEKASQVMQALSALSRLNITVLDVEVRPGRCRSLSFQTPYLLGPVMRGVLCKMQPAGAMFNRHPKTWEEVPFWYGITLGQAALTLAVWAFLFGLWLLGLLHFGGIVLSPDKIIPCLLLTALATWVGPDVHGLLKTAEVVRSHRVVDRLVNRKRYSDAR
jgi:hypothetical protein